MKKNWIKVLTIGVIAGLTLTGCKKADSTKTKQTESSVTEPTDITVLAAASLTEAMADLAREFNKTHPDIRLTFSFGSSGALQTQIEEGAPADIFVSAAQKQMSALVDKKLVTSATVADILTNKVVLIKQKDAEVPISTFEEVAEKATSVAIGGPEVPVGQYTEKIYSALGLWEQVQAKANLGQDVRQVLDWVATGNEPVGVVYATDAKIEPKVTIIAEAPETAAGPVIYPAGVVAASVHPKEALAFVTYLQSPEAMAILETYGFSPLN